MRRNFSVALAGLALLIAGIWATPQDAAAQAPDLAGLANVSGAVTGSKSFKWGQIYFRNVDKRMLYTVYATNGHYDAMHLFPGNYEISAKAKGLQSSVKNVVLKAGKNDAQDLMMQAADETKSEGMQLVSFDQMYPAGTGQATVRATCVGCHGPNFLPTRQWTQEQWESAVATMLQIGFVRFPEQERKDVVTFLSTNFGPDSKKRTLKWDVDLPVDETKLGKAMYIEYYPKPEAGKENARGHGRSGQDPHFDLEGNVWWTDRAQPNRLVRLNPRTGDMKDYVMPDPKGGLHGLTVDSNGIVWTEETQGNVHLVALDPKTEKFERWEIDPEHKLGARLFAEQPVIDSAENVWVGMIYGGAISKWDRKTKEITSYRTPTPNGFTYGVDFDPSGNIWIAEFAQGKVAMLNPKTEKWTEYASPNTNAKIRRVSVDSKGIVWYGVFSSGMLGRIDPKTGKLTESKIPTAFSQPYDVWPDAQDNIWISDNGLGGTLIKYVQSNNSFTFFPTPQFTDQPKLEITRDGAIWYCARTAQDSGVGVFYPDMTKVNTLAAYYPNGVAHGSKYLGKTSASSMHVDNVE